MTAQEIEPGQVISPEQRASAEARAGRISAHLAAAEPHLAGAAEEYAAAVIERDWDHLGLTREEWHAALFAGTRLTVEARRTVHELLSEQGLSVRAIGQATGTSPATVHRDLVSQSGTPAPDQAVRHETSRGRAEPKTPRQRQQAARDRKRQARDQGQGSDPARTTGAAVTMPGLAELKAENAALATGVARLEAENARLREDAEAEVRPRVEAEVRQEQFGVVTAERDPWRERARELEEAVREPACGHDEAWHFEAEAVLAWLASKGFEWDGHAVMQVSA
jgi:Helix-turn-helix domain